MRAFTAYQAQHHLFTGANLRQPFNTPSTTHGNTMQKHLLAAAIALTFAAAHAAPCDTTTDGNATPLMYSAAGGDAQNVRCLLAAGANPNATTEAGVTALMYAASEGHTDTMRALLDKDANVNAAAKSGWTPLMVAATEGFTDAVRALLEKGADVNARLRPGQNATIDDAKRDGETALMMAAFQGRFPYNSPLWQRFVNRLKPASRLRE